MLKYRTYRYDTEIEAVEVLRETAQCVYLPTTRSKRTEQREAKVSDFHIYHDSWEVAHAHLLERSEAAVTRLQRSLEVAIDALSRVNAMRKPA